MEGYIAEIRMFAGNFAPRSWLFCQGQIMSIAQNTALFALVGTTFGGNGQTTFGLPDFRGRVARGTGTGPGLSTVNLGEQAGTPTVTLISTNLPQHNHAVLGTLTPQAAGDGALGTDPTNRRIGPGTFYSGNTDDLINMAPLAGTLTTSLVGNNQPFSVMPPYLGMNYIICIEGIFPSRN